MILIQEGNAYNVPVPTYYVESESEIADIPASAPPGTIVEINSSEGFKIKMKTSTGTWNEL